jgi:hypothetical protein
VTAPGQRSDEPLNLFAALDDYDVRHVVTHLMRAGRDRDIHRLMGLEIGEERRNGWFVERERRGDVGGYLVDVARAWSAADAVNAAGAEQQEPSPLIGQEVLYALATSSVHSLSSNIPPILLAALLENRIWTQDQAVAAARQATTLGSRVDGLATVAVLSPQPDRIALSRQALAVVRAGIGSTDDWKPKEALARLVPLVPTELLPEVLPVARTFPEPAGRAETLVQLARYLREPLRQATLSEAVAAARAVHDSAGLPDYPRSQRNYPRSQRARALLNIVDNLPEPQREDSSREALAIARSLSGEDSWRARIIADVAEHLAEPARLDVLREALQAVRAVPQEPVDPTSSMRWTQERTMALTEIAPKLPAALLDEAVAIAYELPAPYDRDNALEALIPRLAESGKLDQALVALRAMEGNDQATALADAAERLSSVTDLRTVLSAARDVYNVGGSYALARVQAIVAPRLARQGLHAEANSIAQTVDDPWLRLQMCAELAEILPQDLRHRAIDDALAAGQSDRVQFSLRVSWGATPVPPELAWR